MTPTFGSRPESGPAAEAEAEGIQGGRSSTFEEGLGGGRCFLGSTAPGIHASAESGAREAEAASPAFEDTAAAARDGDCTGSASLGDKALSGSTTPGTDNSDPESTFEKRLRDGALSGSTAPGIHHSNPKSAFEQRVRDKALSGSTAPGIRNSGSASRDSVSTFEQRVRDKALSGSTASDVRNSAMGASGAAQRWCAFEQRVRDKALSGSTAPGIHNSNPKPAFEQRVRDKALSGSTASDVRNSAMGAHDNGGGGGPERDPKRSTFEQRLRDKMHADPTTQGVPNSAKRGEGEADAMSRAFEESLRRKVEPVRNGHAGLEAAAGDDDSSGSIEKVPARSAFDQRLRDKMRADRTTQGIPRPAKRGERDADATSQAFEECLRRKMEPVRNGRAGLDLEAAAGDDDSSGSIEKVPARSTYDQRLTDKMYMDRTAQGIPHPAKRGESDADAMSKAFEECLIRKADPCRSSYSQDTQVSTCLLAECNYAHGTPAEEANLASNTDTSRVSLGELFAGLQDFMEANGNLSVPRSHPCLSLLKRIASETEASPHAGAQSQEIPRNSQRRQSAWRRVTRLFGSGAGSFSFLVAATLVEEDDGEVVIAERVSYLEQKSKKIAFLMTALLVLLATLLSLALSGVFRMEEKVDVSEPTSSPTFDPRPIIEIIQERGHIRCGMSDEQTKSGGFNLNLCRSFAAVILGDGNSVEGVITTSRDRWNHLAGRYVDVLVGGDSHTVQRELAGFIFSTPFKYDGAVYFGNRTFVDCAEERRRYGDCGPLRICVQESTTQHDVLKAEFPSGNFVDAPSFERMIEMLFSGVCNVAAYDKSSILQRDLLMSELRDRSYVVGEKCITKEVLAAVTRNNDEEFSDVINWVVQTLVRADEQGLKKDSDRCRNHTELSSSPTDLDFFNAVWCVGSYSEISHVGSEDPGMNQVNNGTGMLYAIPFGDLEDSGTISPSGDTLLAKIRSRGSLICGVVAPDNFRNVTHSEGLVGMGVDYCRTLAAALFSGNPDAILFHTYHEAEGYPLGALENGTLDVLVGGRIQGEYDFKGLHFSSPYYVGNEPAGGNVSFYSIATWEGDPLFDSFVNCVIMATIYAEENGIDGEESLEMPLVSLFGSDLSWALRDSIDYSGNYGRIYSKNFGPVSNYNGSYGDIYSEYFFHEVVEAELGRNSLNKGGPMLLSFPYLHQT